MLASLALLALLTESSRIMWCDFFLKKELNFVTIVNAFLEAAYRLEELICTPPPPFFWYRNLKMSRLILCLSYLK